MPKIKIIFEPTEQKPFLVIYKPKNLPSAPLKEDDENNALFQAKKLYPNISNVNGKKRIENGLLHRLDTATDGLLLIALTQECYDFLICQQNEGKFLKTYAAECDFNPKNAELLGGFPPFECVPSKTSSFTGFTNFTDFDRKVSQEFFENQLDSFFNSGKKNGLNVTAKSFFRSYGEKSREVRPVTDCSGKAAIAKVGKQKIYSTDISVLKNISEKNEKKILVECKISQGYRHQVRSHLAWLGLPIKNDSLYNADFRCLVKKNNHPQIENEDDLRFTATKIEFEYPKGDLNSYEIAFTWT